MSLYEQVGLDVRVVVSGLGQLEGDTGGQLSQEGVLLVPDGDTLVLGSRGEDLQKTLQLGLVVQGHAEQF